MADNKVVPAQTTATDEIADEKLNKVSGGATGLTAAEQAQLAKLGGTKLPSTNVSLTDTAVASSTFMAPKV